MAKVNKKRAVKQSQGLPSKEQILTSPTNVDTVPAQINGVDGSPQSPAALTEGEFVFSLPAIIALGEGDYDTGLKLLEEMHTQLQAVGDKMVGELQGEGQGGGLSGAADLGAI